MSRGITAISKLGYNYNVKVVLDDGGTNTYTCTTYEGSRNIIFATNKEQGVIRNTFGNIDVQYDSALITFVDTYTNVYTKIYLTISGTDYLIFKGKVDKVNVIIRRTSITLRFEGEWNYIKLQSITGTYSGDVWSVQQQTKKVLETETSYTANKIYGHIGFSSTNQVQYFPLFNIDDGIDKGNTTFQIPIANTTGRIGNFLVQGADSKIYRNYAQDTDDLKTFGTHTFTISGYGTFPIRKFYAYANWYFAGVYCSALNTYDLFYNDSTDTIVTKSLSLPANPHLIWITGNVSDWHIYWFDWTSDTSWTLHLYSSYSDTTTTIATGTASQTLTYPSLVINSGETKAYVCYFYQDSNYDFYSVIIDIDMSAGTSAEYSALYVDEVSSLETLQVTESDISSDDDRVLFGVYDPNSTSWDGWVEYVASTNAINNDETYGECRGAKFYNDGTNEYIVIGHSGALEVRNGNSSGFFTLVTSYSGVKTGYPSPGYPDYVDVNIEIREYAPLLSDGTRATTSEYLYVISGNGQGNAGLYPMIISKYTFDTVENDLSSYATLETVVEYLITQGVDNIYFKPDGTFDIYPYPTNPPFHNFYRNAFTEDDYKIEYYKWYTWGSGTVEYKKYWTWANYNVELFDKFKDIFVEYLDYKLSSGILEVRGRLFY